MLGAACPHRTAVFQDTGHLVPLDRPAQFTATLLELAARQAMAAAGHGAIVQKLTFQGEIDARDFGPGQGVLAARLQ